MNHSLTVVYMQHPVPYIAGFSVKITLTLALALSSFAGLCFLKEKQAVLLFPQTAVKNTVKKWNKTCVHINLITCGCSHFIQSPLEKLFHYVSFIYTTLLIFGSAIVK